MTTDQSFGKMICEQIVNDVYVAQRLVNGVEEVFKSIHCKAREQENIGYVDVVLDYEELSEAAQALLRSLSNVLNRLSANDLALLNHLKEQADDAQQRYEASLEK